MAQKPEGELHHAGLYSTQNLGLLLNLLGLKPPDGALGGFDGVLTGLRTGDLLPALLQAQCRNGPVILRLEDIHWIDTGTAALVRMLVCDAQIADLLVVQTLRPEYCPDWLDGPRVTTLALGPLADAEIAALVQERLAASDLPGDLLATVKERSGGNPLSCEKILSYGFSMAH